MSSAGRRVTEEFHPGFRNSVASYTVSLLNPKVIADLDLHRHGLRVVERKVSNFLPLGDDSYFMSAPGLRSPRWRNFPIATRHGSKNTSAGSQ
jgi:hypothetical protein